MKTTLQPLLTALLILLMVYAAVSKLQHFDTFRGQLYNQSFPHALAEVLAYVLPAAELLTATLLLFTRTQYWGLLGATGLMGLFSGYVTLVMLHYWDRVPCSCGGILSQMPWGAHLIFNYVFLLVSGIALYLQASTDHHGDEVPPDL